LPWNIRAREADPQRQGDDDAQSHRDKSSGRHLMTEFALRRIPADMQEIEGQSQPTAAPSGWMIIVSGKLANLDNLELQRRGSGVGRAIFRLSESSLRLPTNIATLYVLAIMPPLREVFVMNILQAVTPSPGDSMRPGVGAVW
jgi:hypothetical protein